MKILYDIIIAAWFGGVFLNVGGTLLCLYFIRPLLFKNKSVNAIAYRPISILKPLKGLEKTIKKNLESFFLLDYPNFELLFSVRDASDPVLPLLRRLMAKYPDVRARVIIDETTIGPNPKVNNLYATYNAALHNWVLIADSNILAGRNYLKELAMQFTDDCSMLSSIVAGTNARGIVGMIESSLLNTVYARPLVVSNRIGHPCMMGKTLLFRKDKMEAIGGLESISPYLAEDYMMGQQFNNSGFKTVLSRVPVCQALGKPGLVATWGRHVRWGRIRKIHAPAIFLLEPLMTNALVSGVVAALVFSHLNIVTPGLFFLLHTGLWFTSDCLMMRKMGQALNWKTPFLWLLLEMSHIPLWCHIASSNSIRWKTGVWKLRRDGTLA
ncbi:MAG: ceramide glucosyltransferase [Bdellovibrionota bacterium]